MNHCKICEGPAQVTLKARIMNKYDVEYYQCTNCGFVQTEKPYWLEESYQSPMNFSDTGIMHRNKKFSKIVTSLISLFFDKEKKFLDYAGGYGVFTRMMRDIGFDFYWTDPYTQNLLARGFEAHAEDCFEAITTFECFEHLEYPIDEISKMMTYSKNIFFSTEITPTPLPKIEDWWYYATEHGQHIAFYSIKSFEIIAQKFNVHYYNLGNMHIFSEKKIGFLGSVFLRFKYAQHILYLLSPLFSLTLSSKTMADMNALKKQ